MGQKVNPHGLRVGVIKDWDSRWFANKSDFGDTLVEDYNVRKFIKKNLYAAGVPKIEIERFADKVRIHIHCAKPPFRACIIPDRADRRVIKKTDGVYRISKIVE